MRKMKRLAGIALLVAVTALPAFAQAPRIVHGTISSIDGGAVTIKQADGPDVAIKLLDNAKVFGVKTATLADLKPGAWIGVGAMPQPDGSQKAILVTIFSDAQRGVGAGFKPWDRPGSTMTNGTAGEPVESVNGHAVVVKYNGGEQKILIGPDAKIRMYVVGSKDDLKPGVLVSVFNPDKAPDGSLQTARINYGIGGMTP